MKCMCVMIGKVVMILWLSLCIVEGRVTFLQISVHDIHAYFLRICREYCDSHISCKEYEYLVIVLG